MVASKRSYTLAELSELLSGEMVGTGSTVISGVSFSSVATRLGDIFVAVPGTNIDGAEFIAQAQTNGATAVVVRERAQLVSGDGVVVDDPRLALSRLASAFASNPSKSLTTIGVTGTNGKSTVHWLCSKILEGIGKRCLRVGTLGIALDGIFYEDSLTSPDPISLHQSLAKAKDFGALYVAMEVSSHGLHQKRLDDIHFDTAIFTNLTRDHIDYHGSMESYYLAKRRLFELLKHSAKPRTTAIINVDSDFGLRLAKECREMNLTTWTYGSQPGSDLSIETFEQDLSGSSWQLSFQGQNWKFRSPAIGKYNAENFTAAFGALVAVGLSPQVVIEQLSKVTLVPGRLEPVGDSDYGIFVDYAHTPDALENAIRALRPLVKQKLWVIFGCGGDRDRGKRPMMGQIACELADQIVVTSDNPRTEKPDAIIEDILAGITSKATLPILVEVDRRRAIQQTIAALSPGDVLLIAGKGHEDYQIIGCEKVHFSDQEEARAALKNKTGVA